MSAMDGLSALFLMLFFGSLLPFVTLAATALMVLALHVIAALAFEHT
jgi:hypothetical protein